MSLLNSNKPEVKISYDSMEAFLTLPIPEGDAEYSTRDLVDALEMKGVKAGIDQEMLLKMVKEKVYNQERRVAVGKKPVEGHDGSYEFLFNRNFNRKPKQLPDGSVDYHIINLIATVEKDTLVAIYHPCEQGKNGYTVKGGPLNAKRCKELKPLRGKGFYRGANENEYYAEMSGKIEFTQDRLMISPVYEISGDVGVNTGNIDFIGDVTIHGNVRNGMSIKATGTVTIDGIVENVSIDAGKDIVLKSGLMGNNRAVIKTKGSLFAKFIEYASLNVIGNINAEVLLECDVVCGERIIISGKSGRVVGGFVRAVAGFEANSIGNDMEVRTEIAVGVDGDIHRRLKVLEHKIEVAKKQLSVIDEKIAEIERENTPKTVMDKPSADPRKMSMLRTKIHENTVIQESKLEQDELTALIDKADGACVKVVGTVYPGVFICIDGFGHEVKDEHYAVTFKKVGDNIRMERDADALI
ncbi:MAG: FapA family protein [Lachnospiraceae bacterium]|nr:FapA family protein [Lachnospiraceae bacterium]